MQTAIFTQASKRQFKKYSRHYVVMDYIGALRVFDTYYVFDWAINIYNNYERFWIHAVTEFYYRFCGIHPVFSYEHAQYHCR